MDQQPHKPGELVNIHWPGGPYDFRIRFDYADKVNAPGWEDWIVLRGFVVEPRGPQHQCTRAFYCHPVAGGGYAMLPLQVG